MANLEIQESNSRPDRVGAATYASIAASSWNANDMHSLFNHSQPSNDITAMFGNLDLFAGPTETQTGYIGVYKPRASPMPEKPENKDSVKPWELPAAPEVAQRGGVIADNGNQARWQRAQEVHKLGQDESATNLYGTTKQPAQKFELFDSVHEQTLLTANIEPEVPKFEQTLQRVGSDFSKQQKIAQALDGYMPPPTLLPDFIVRAELQIWNATEKPLNGLESQLMESTTAANSQAWEQAAMAFSSQLKGAPIALLKAYTRNELACYGREDLAQDIAATDGKSLGANPTLGMAQITVKGIQEFEAKYPQLKHFLESKGYSGPGHEMKALLDPECVPMIVAAKTATIVEDLATHGIKHPTSEQIAYGYNPDVYSYSSGHGRDYKALYLLEVTASKAAHWDQKKEYYANNPDVVANSEHIKNVLHWMK